MSLLSQPPHNRRKSLDLNTLPEDFIRDHSKQVLDDSSSVVSGIFSRKRTGAKDERSKVYECRFCSLKFGKSQALGGHMNRHRQERETETLNQARQLVFGTDNMLPQPPHRLGGVPVPAVNGGYHYPAGLNMQGTTVYPTTTRLFSGTSTTIFPQHVYSSLLDNTYSSQYPNSQLTNDYFIDHYVSSNPQYSFQNVSCSIAPNPHDGTYN